MTAWTPPRSPTAATTPLVEIVVTENLMAPAAARLHALVSDALALRPEHLVIDLAQCGAADALAIDVLLAAHRRAWQLGCRLTLRAPSPKLMWIFQLSRVDHVFEISTMPAPHPAPGRRPETTPAGALPQVRP